LQKSEKGGEGIIRLQDLQYGWWKKASSRLTKQCGWEKNVFVAYKNIGCKKVIKTYFKKKKKVVWDTNVWLAK
jgi:hypothetical protein